MAVPRLEYLVIFGVLLAVAAGADLVHRRVPNAVSVALFLGGLASQSATGGWRSAAGAVAVTLAVGAVSLVAWSKGILGGGDVKLLAGTAAWMGTGRIGTFLVATALAGGVLAVPFLRGARATCNELLVAAAQAGTSVRAGPAPARVRRVPLAVAIAVGAAAAVAVG